jgi:hypothetical protein
MSRVVVRDSDITLTVPTFARGVNAGRAGALDTRSQVRVLQGLARSPLASGRRAV